jgi:hypothetical protein
MIEWRFRLPKEEIGMRVFVTSTFVLALVLAPAAAFAQQPPAQQPPAQQPPAQPPATQQPPAGQPPAAAQPAALKVAFTTPAGLLLVQVKPDQTATFEEMMGKIMNGVGNSSDPQTKAQAGTWHYYRATEPAGANVMYIVVIDPAKPDTEYQFLEVLNKTLTDDQKRDPATQDMYKKYAGAIASMNKLNITPSGR